MAAGAFRLEGTVCGGFDFNAFSSVTSVSIIDSSRLSRRSMSPGSVACRAYARVGPASNSASLSAGGAVRISGVGVTAGAAGVGAGAIVGGSAGAAGAGATAGPGARTGAPREGAGAGAAAGADEVAGVGSVGGTAVGAAAGGCGALSSAHNVRIDHGSAASPTNTSAHQAARDNRSADRPFRIIASLLFKCLAWPNPVAPMGNAASASARKSTVFNMARA